MISKPIALGLLAAACVTAAGGGAFLAVRQNPAVPSAQAEAQPANAPNTQPGVAESEAIIAPESAVAPTAAAAPESRDAATSLRDRSHRCGRARDCRQRARVYET